MCIIPARCIDCGAPVSGIEAGRHAVCDRCIEEKQSAQAELDYLEASALLGNRIRTGCKLAHVPAWTVGTIIEIAPRDQSKTSWMIAIRRDLPSQHPVDWLDQLEFDRAIELFADRAN